MDLRHYLFKNNMKLNKLASIVGCSASYLSQIVHGKCLPTAPMAVKIEEATNGVIKAKSFRSRRARKMITDGRRILKDCVGKD